MSQDANAVLDGLRQRGRSRLGWCGFLYGLAWGLPSVTLLAGIFAALALGTDPADPWFGRLDASSWGVAAVGVAVAISLALAWAWRCRRALDGPGGLAVVARHLDARWPNAEHSSTLVMRPVDELSLVERLQRHRVIHALGVLDDAAERDLLPGPPLRRAARAAALGLLAAAGLAVGLSTTASWQRRTPEVASGARLDDAATATPALVASQLRVEPPAYTGLKASTHDTLSVSAATGSLVRWRLRTVGGVEAAYLVLGEERWALAPSGDASEPDSGRVFQGDRRVDDTLVYTVHLEKAGEVVARSPFVRLTVLPDRPPSVIVRSPTLVSEVDPAGGRRLPLVADVDDDYGVSDVAIVATLALGAGEQVAFREARFDFTLREPLPVPVGGSDNRHRQRVRRTLDLEAVGLEPGGELYFFVEVRDNAPIGQRTRSASHVVRWPGDTQRSVDLGSGIPMLVPPDMFRSQRQIIIDAERLLAEQEAISRTAFERRSNNLGLDQHALRLRYGALLGEEFEDGRPAGEPEGTAVDGLPGGQSHRQHDGHDHDEGATTHSAEAPRARHDRHPGSPAADHPHDHGHAAEHGGLLSPPAARPGAPVRMIDLVGELEGDLVHVHDSEESASFFPSEVQQTLKSSLANMWESEKHLRLFGPAEALPYAYRALRLLKEVQQASRVYVRRVGFDPTPLDLERRLTGDDVGDVRGQRRRSEPVAPEQQPQVRMALRALSEWDGSSATGRAPGASEVPVADVLDAVLPVVLARATRTDAAAAMMDLGAVEDLRALAVAVRSGKASALSDDRLVAVRAMLWNLLPTPEAAAVVMRSEVENPGWWRYRQLMGTP